MHEIPPASEMPIQAFLYLLSAEYRYWLWMIRDAHGVPAEDVKHKLEKLRHLCPDSMFSRASCEERGDFLQMRVWFPEHMRSLTKAQRSAFAWVELRKYLDAAEAEQAARELFEHNLGCALGSECRACVGTGSEAVRRRLMFQGNPQMLKVDPGDGCMSCRGTGRQNGTA